MRGKGKSTIVWLLMGMLVLGLGGFGVTNFSGGSADIGSVGDVGISSQDYARTLRAEMQDFSARTGRQISAAEAKAIGVDQAALARLYTAAALEAEANRVGVSVGDKAVAEQITGMSAFRGMNGQFDRNIYADALRREGMREAEFEHDLRMDLARLILQRAALAGVEAPQPVVALTQGWLLETRDIHWRELTAEDLPAPVAAPDEATLQAWHKANADRFTAPEIRKITYVWLTPEMLEDEVEVDEQALRDLYQDRIDEFQQPERRMVERLVFPTVAAAEEAKARIDRGEVTFEQLAAERGLTLADIDLGEVSQAELGAAGEAVFALDQPGVAGPASSELGPALFSMNAILEPLDIPFEQARDDLRLEAAVDRARRQIEERSGEFADLLAGGATLEDMARDTPMRLGQIDWSAGAEADPDGIDAYPEFRQRAAQLTEKDFPELFETEDGGVFALRLDELVPPALIPFEEVRDRVAEDWTRNETHRQLLALAEERRVEAEAAAEPGIGPAPAAATAPVAQALGAAAPVSGDAEAAAADKPAPAPGTPAPNLSRGGFINGVPQDVVAQAFEIAEEGATEVVDAENRVFLVTLDKIHPAATDGEEGAQIRAGISARLADSLRQDVFDYFARALQAQGGVTLNQTAVDAVNAQVQ
ncbi:SurA N-terminal domain-containing protein [Paracoccus sp. PS-1]|uniref:peptidylprolyl isomerase n=1 Tax=unclassified Paracoccus (in: a-proteobacteria) TaxID=2688777 RepID=UPI00048DDDB1|nr:MULTISPECIES: peptidylprolyl isomerase [unclassified Paracoccus (in: a-proteobacteria)]MDQ7263997.1 SurA N-terminal domain-containing protein [Paracoccus sp. PS1]